MRPTRILAAAALVVFPVVAVAQVSDTLQLGERVRVRVASTSGNLNLFTGNIASITPDTLVLAIPGGKGTIILPRASINEVAKSDGRESHLRNVPRVMPMIIGTALLASTMSNRPPGSSKARGWTILALDAGLITAIIGRKPPERWRPVESWLNR